MRHSIIYYLFILIILNSCGNSGNGELTGVKHRPKFYQPDPHGMAYVPMGSYTMGVGDQDVAYAMINEPKTVSVAAFYMDETEITNNEYRQFVNWVRDSIARRLVGEANPDRYLISQDKNGQPYDPPFLNWKNDIKWNGEQEREALEALYLPEHERYFRKKQIDTRKLYYEYYWVDLKAAASKDYSQPGDPKDASFANRPQGMKDRTQYVRKEVINVYPDTLCWIHDYTYSFNDPQTERYFWHPAYDNYPVVGVNWKQARAFCIWRTQLLSSYLHSKNEAVVSEFRLPSEQEWEWAARGGNTLSAYPWGGPYTRNKNGCFLANFKPMRGDYASDGGLTTIIVAHYPPNDWGLYDMAGNVAEWTNTAYDEATYNFAWDLNPNYVYNAKDSDPPSMKRKVVRGGSWKDIAYFLQVSTRAYEYQDTAKCYIGFRCVQNYLGRQKDDNPSRASRIYN